MKKPVVLVAFALALLVTACRGDEFCQSVSGIPTAVGLVLERDFAVHVIPSDRRESRNLSLLNVERFLDSTPLSFGCAQDRLLRSARNDECPKVS